MNQISGEMALDIVRRAFFPFTCGADIYDCNEKMRIHVVGDTGQSLLKLTGITKDEFGSRDRLGELIHKLRNDLSQHVGVELEPWDMPDIKPLAN